MPLQPRLNLDALVVGAGPAGSACAQALARAGLSVQLVDQHQFPRDKVCGDGLIPDAHAALKRLGVYEQVMAQAQAAQHVACVSPSGVRVEVPGTLAVLPRKVLDNILCQAAQAAGAQFVAPVRFVAPLREGGRVVGALLQQGDAQWVQRARWVVLATGASVPALAAAGHCERRTPSAVALRGYVHCPELVGRITQLEVVWHARLRGDYGWIFPEPDGVFNIGVGLAEGYQPGRPKAMTLRQLLDAFCEVHPPARELMQKGRVLGEFKGAPLRCSLEGASWTEPGLLVTGEAAGSTYAFTGEGIGKAMETGLLSAQTITRWKDKPLAEADAGIKREYEATLSALRPRFKLYERASQVNRYPYLMNWLFRRANASPRLLQRMAGALEETSNPGHLFSLRGAFKLLTLIR
jgi:menaquinone-9 beta-reductase